MAIPFWVRIYVICFLSETYGKHLAAVIEWNLHSQIKYQYWECTIWKSDSLLSVTKSVTEKIDRENLDHTSQMINGLLSLRAIPLEIWIWRRIWKKKKKECGPWNWAEFLPMGMSKISRFSTCNSVVLGAEAKLARLLRISVHNIFTYWR